MTTLKNKKVFVNKGKYECSTGRVQGFCSDNKTLLIACRDRRHPERITYVYATPKQVIVL